MAELAFAYEGALQYESLKGYPNREIMLLTETMNRINKRKEAAINSKSNTVDMGSAPAIGEF